MGACNKTTDEAPVRSVDLRVEPSITIVVTRPESEGITPVGVAKPKKSVTPPEPMRLRVSLQSPSDTATDSHNTPLPPVFYIIAGRGPAAVINHTTLWQGGYLEKRMDDAMAGDLPVLHVGFSNPWSGFFEHGMGQPSYLLNLPGFEQQPGSPGFTRQKDGGLVSKVFGACVDHEMARCVTHEISRWDGKDREKERFLAAAGTWPELDGWVAWIQSKAKEPLGAVAALIKKEPGGDLVVEAIEEMIKTDWPAFPRDFIAPYRVVVLRKVGNFVEPILLYAQFIDLCTGSGRPRYDLGAVKGLPKTGRLEPWRDPATWDTPCRNRKIAVATEGVREEFNWTRGARICIGNGGAIALNAGERARDEACRTDWFHSGTLTDSFNGNARNYTYMQKKGSRDERGPGEDGKITDDDLFAAAKPIRLGSFTQLNETTADCKVKIGPGIPRGQTLKPPAQRDPYLTDYWRKTSTVAGDAFTVSDEYELEYPGVRASRAKYDRIFLHTGLVTNECGQPKQIGCDGKVEPFEADGRMVCMASGDGAIRVLGAAAQMYPDLPAFNERGSSPSDKMWRYRQVLPASAVPDGFILSALNIAAANRFFAAAPNENVNSGQTEELIAALRKERVFIAVDRLAESIVAARNSSNGFQDIDDLVTKVNKNIDDKASAEVKRIEARYMEEIKNPSLTTTEKEEKLKVAAAERAQVLLGAAQDKKRLADNKDKVSAALKFSY